MTGDLGERAAFPSASEYTPSGMLYAQGQPGLSKRELFALSAMQGLLAGSMDTDCGPARFARDAVAMADALLAELAKGEQP